MASRQWKDSRLKRGVYSSDDRWFFGFIRNRRSFWEAKRQTGRDADCFTATLSVSHTNIWERVYIKLLKSDKWTPAAKAVSIQTSSVCTISCYWHIMSCFWAWNLDSSGGNLDMDTLGITDMDGRGLRNCSQLSKEHTQIIIIIITCSSQRTVNVQNLGDFTLISYVVLHWDREWR